MLQSGRRLETCQASLQKSHKIIVEKAYSNRSMAGDLYDEFAAANFLVPNLPAPLPVAWLKKLGIDWLPSGLKVEDFDNLHTLIFVDEVSIENARQYQ